MWWGKGVQLNTEQVHVQQKNKIMDERHAQNAVLKACNDDIQCKKMQQSETCCHVTTAANKTLHKFSRI